MLFIFPFCWKNFMKTRAKEYSKVFSLFFCVFSPIYILISSFRLAFQKGDLLS